MLLGLRPGAARDLIGAGGTAFGWHPDQLTTSRAVALVGGRAQDD